MILASTLAVRGAGGSQFLQGNAKVYDGSFDYDSTNESFLFDSSDPYSFLIALHKEAFTANNFEFIFQISNGTRNLYIAIENAFGIQGRVRFSVANNRISSNRLIARAETTLLEEGGKYVIGVRYSGGNNQDSIDVWVNSQKQSVTFLDSTRNITPFTLNESVYLGTSSNNTSLKLSGQIKQCEVIDSALNDTDMELATDPTAGGSFRAVGVLHDSGQYLFAPDFDKQNGQPLTTFADTPSYTITPFGGATYVDYPSL